HRPHPSPPREDRAEPCPTTLRQNGLGRRLQAGAVMVARLPASSYAGPVVALLTAVVGVALFSWSVLGMPRTDLRDLVLFLTVSGGGSMLAGYALVSAAPRFGLGGVRPRLLLAHLVVLAIAFANIVVTAWLMFIS